MLVSALDEHNKTKKNLVDKTREVRCGCVAVAATDSRPNHLAMVSRQRATTDPPPRTPPQVNDLNAFWAERESAWEVELGTSCQEAQQSKKAEIEANTLCQRTIQEKEALQARLEVFEASADSVKTLSHDALVSSIAVMGNSIYNLTTELDRRETEAQALSSSWCIDSCPVCMDPEMRPDHVLPCGHSYCGKCVDQIDTCAQCSAGFAYSAQIYNITRKRG